MKVPNPITTKNVTVTSPWSLLKAGAGAVAIGTLLFAGYHGGAWVYRKLAGAGKMAAGKTAETAMSIWEA